MIATLQKRYADLKDAWAYDSWSLLEETASTLSKWNTWEKDRPRKKRRKYFDFHITKEVKTVHLWTRIRRRTLLLNLSMSA